MDDSTVENKTTRSLIFIGIAFFLIFIKIWHLTVIKKDEKIAESKLPQNKAILYSANRGTICDLYGIPLALNRIRYNACIYYAQIRQIPSFKWKEANGKKEKVFERKEHIKNLSALLAKELNMDRCTIEDLIHSKASLLPHVPFVIKENISEKEYYRLRMLERDWIGLHAEIAAERFYPHEKAASDVIGYMGAITQREYLSIANEIKTLELILEKEKNHEPLFLEGYKSFEEVQNRLSELKEKAYSVNDLIGKNGLEASYEELLRGFHGKKVFAVDIKGNMLKELPNSKEPISGDKLKTNISLELQLFAESLLAKEEKLRDGKSMAYNDRTKLVEMQKQPFIKGGAIIVLDPNTGAILTCASYPRFNPNDFILSCNKKLRQKKQQNILKWFEAPSHISNIYNGKEPLKRELYSIKKGFFEEEKKLSLSCFLKLILPSSSPIFPAIENVKNIKNAISLQEDFEALLFSTKTEDAEDLVSSFFDENKKNDALKKLDEKSLILRNKIAPFFRGLQPEEMLLLVDICRILVHSPSFSNSLIDLIGKQSLEAYWDTSKSAIILEDSLQEMLRPIFKKAVFQPWRKEHQKDFLRQKREEEKEKKLFPRPYLDYLENMENELFLEFWQKHRLIFLTSFIKNADFADSSLKIFGDYLKTKKEKKDPGKKWTSALQALEESLVDLNFDQTYEFLKTIRSFKNLDRKLLGRYSFRKKDPLEKDLALSFYPPYGFGYTKSEAYRESAPLGSIFKIVVAESALKKHYEKLSFSKAERLNPLTMTDALSYVKEKNEMKQAVGFSEDGRPYFRHYKGGRLPRSSHLNVGKIDIIQALAQSSNPYFSILASDFLEPSELLKTAKELGFGSKTNIDLPFEISGRLPEDLETNRTGLYSFAIGQHSLITTPLQIAVMLAAIANNGEVLKPQIVSAKKEIIRKIDIPSAVRNTILSGLDQTLWGEKGSARPEIIKKLKNDPYLQEQFLDLKHQLIGKTSTAEIVHKCDLFSRPEKYNHIWFGGISFTKDEIKGGFWEKPELVVVVYLKFGDSGKEAAPLAAEIVHKYRSLKAKYAP